MDSYTYLNKFLSTTIERINLDNISLVEEVEDTYYDEEVVLSTTLPDDELKKLMLKTSGSEILDNHRVYYYYFVENSQVFLRARDDGSVLWCGRDFCISCQDC